MSGRLVNWKLVLSPDVVVETSSLCYGDSLDDLDHDVALLHLPDGTSIDIAGDGEVVGVRHYWGHFDNEIKTVECLSTAEILSAVIGMWVNSCCGVVR